MRGSIYLLGQPLLAVRFHPAEIVRTAKSVLQQTEIDANHANGFSSALGP
jgi:hypothetical protein